MSIFKHPPCDFRSDTLTLPTPAMMEAIAHARLGDSARGDDPTVADLESLSREITGMEDALFLPSATMANLAAVIAHDTRGGEVIVEESAHIYNSEGGGLSALAAAVARPIKGTHGMLAGQQVAAAIKAAGNAGTAPTRLLCLENTHNAGGGTVMRPEQMAALRDVAHRAGIPVHLDGARLFNAAVYLDVPLATLCRDCDSVTLALSKGLRAPVGAILAGSRPFMAKARHAARVLGGGMRQAGLIAAPAIVALQEPWTFIKVDHARARRLAEGLAAIDPRLVDLQTVQTNIVNCRTAACGRDASAVAKALRAEGVHAIGKGERLRFVTHAGITDEDVTRAIAAMARVLDSVTTEGAAE
jgi:threonine aldolase